MKDETEEDCEFLDSIYLPSKYPIGSVLPYYEPNLEICNQGIDIASKIFKITQRLLYQE
ncbi:hypothetical protein HZA55_04575 [Candidatus Poribacteria bacterium]|nr:hypothetical protein [Candidatus Poribacteria bacterium]